MDYRSGRVDWAMFGEVMLVAMVLSAVVVMIVAVLGSIWAAHRRRVMWQRYHDDRRDAEDWTKVGQGVAPSYDRRYADREED